jgi:hypothetical protein
MYITYIPNINHKKSNNIRSEYEGVGAQYQRIIALLSIAKRHNLKYIHIPIKVGHNYNNDPEWHNNWDKMFNIQKLSDTIDYSTIQKQHIYTNPITLDNLLNHNNNNSLSIINCYTNPFNIFDKNSNYYLSYIQNDLINAYDENNSNRTLIYDKTKTSIAIHIRVFNQQDDIINFNNYMNNVDSRHYMTCDLYLSLIKKIKNQYQNSDIHIFSQEHLFDIHYKRLRDIEYIKIHFDDLDTFDTFHHLCKSDVLVMAPSSLSIIAAFYNKNTVMFLPFNHPPSLKSWIILDPSKLI